ncbi:hypothetical protein [Magnetovirga frankeli]
MLDNLLPLALASGLGYVLLRLLLGMQDIWQDRSNGKLRLGR